MDITREGNFSYGLPAFNASGNHTGNITVTARAPSALKTVAGVVLPTALIILMFGVGCAVEIKTIFKHLRKPFGPAIGMVSQFVLLPLMTFGLAKALRFEAPVAVGMLILASCPGGSTSNIFSYWVDGDVSLSLTMTTLSTIMALGMMPLNLWIYSRAWGGGQMIIPYVSILISLAMTVTPAAVGIFIRWKWETLGVRLAKVGNIFGIVVVIITEAILSLLAPHRFQVPWKIYLATVLFPAFGYTLGFTFAKICRMDYSLARTVSLETGVQNFPLCITVITLTFSKSDIRVIGLIPLLFGAVSVVESLMYVLAYRLFVCLSTFKKRNSFSAVHVTEETQS